MVIQRSSRVAISLSLSAARHPLRRRVDNVEAALMTMLVVVFLIGAPLAVFLGGRAADAAALRQQRAEGSWHQVGAVLQEGASQGQIGLDGDWNIVFVTARWPADGGYRYGAVAAPLNARTGQRITEWVNSAGRLTRPRLTAGDVRDEAVSGGLAALAGLVVVLALAAVAVRVAAGRCRLAGWARAWQAADPRCSQQR